MSNTNQPSLYVDKNNDKYLENMELLNKRKNEWYKMHPKYRLYQTLVWVVLALCFIGILVVWRLTKDAETTMESLPLHISIWATAIITFLISRHGKNVYEHPFHGLHSGRFEAGPKGLYYIYQLGMTMDTYYIRDKDLKEIIRDDEANCLYIRGKGKLEVHDRKGVKTREIDGIYALVGFDFYDLDDLLAPYAEYVTDAPGTLREKYLKEGSEQ